MAEPNTTEIDGQRGREKADHEEMEDEDRNVKEKTETGRKYMKCCVDRIMTTGLKSRECDPDYQENRPSGMASGMEHGMAASFNALARSFLVNMLKIFKGDILIMKMLQELQKHMHNEHSIMSSEHMKKVDPVNVPSLMFAKQISQTIKLPSGETKTIYDLIMDKNEYLAVGRYDVQMLNMFNFRDKYKKLNEKNKTYVWNTLNKLVLTASAVVMVENDKMGAVDDLIGAVVKKSKNLAVSSGGRLDMRKASQIISSDKEIQKVSKSIIKSTTQDEGTDGVDRCTSSSTETSKKREKLSCADMQKYLMEMTGKTVDIAGLAGPDGMIDISDEGITTMMSNLSSKGAGALNKESARAANTRERLRAKLERRRETTKTTTTTGFDEQDDGIEGGQDPDVI